MLLFEIYPFDQGEIIQGGLSERVSEIDSSFKDQAAALVRLPFACYVLLLVTGFTIERFGAGRLEGVSCKRRRRFARNFLGVLPES